MPRSLIECEQSRWNLPLLDNGRDISRPLGMIGLKVYGHASLWLSVNHESIIVRVLSYHKSGTHLALSSTDVLWQRDHITEYIKVQPIWSFCAFGGQYVLLGAVVDL